MSNFIDLEVVPTDYSGYSIFSLLCSYWEICKELITIRELINIDHIRDISRISICGQGLRNIESVLRREVDIKFTTIIHCFIKIQSK